MPATSHRFPPNQLQVERLPILREESTNWSPEPSVVFQFGTHIAEIIDKVWYDKSPVSFGGVSDRDRQDAGRAHFGQRSSPVPFGGVSDRDPRVDRDSDSWSQFRLQCLSAVSQIETTTGVKAFSLCSRRVSSAFRRCLRSRRSVHRSGCHRRVDGSPVPFGGVSDRDITTVKQTAKVGGKSPVPFGGVSDRDSRGSWKPLRSLVQSPVPFGGVSDRDTYTDADYYEIKRLSPVPFGGVSDRDRHQVIKRHRACAAVSSAFRRCLRSRLPELL